MQFVGIDDGIFLKLQIWLILVLFAAVICLTTRKLGKNRFFFASDIMYVYLPRSHRRVSELQHFACKIWKWAPIIHDKRFE